MSEPADRALDSDRTATAPRVSAVVLAYGAEPLIGECLEALLRSEAVALDVVVVDNGCENPALGEFGDRAGVRVLRAPTNLGFAGGCNWGAEHAAGEVLAFVNSDAIVRPGALRELVVALEEQRVGIASASLRLHDRPDALNSAGNPVHYAGFSWAGALGEDASEWESGVHEPASATGAAFALRRTTWDRLGGFWEPMFAYCEDAELSLRCWQAGLSVRYVPTAVVLHHYEFSRNPLKNYLLERNRLALLLTLYERRTLLVLAPALVALEVMVLLVATRQGWAADKCRGWVWLLRNHRLVRARRRYVQGSRSVPDREIVDRLTPDLAPGEETGLVPPRALIAGSRLYWRVARALIKRGS